MKKLFLVIMVLVVGYAMMHMGCMDREPAPVCPVPTELNETDVMIGGFEGVDMLVVVDNSGSMAEEQEILATAFFPLVNSLINPLPGWQWPSVDDVRIAIVTSDMGLSWGGNPYEEGDGWPGTPPGSASGDNGVFQTYVSGSTIDIEHDVIPCDSSNAQCPTGWTCSVTETGEIGTCRAPGGDGTGQVCPDMSSTWSEILPGSPNADMAFEVACLADQGTNGCGFEQQLQSAAAALSRPDQEVFVRDDRLLTILVVSDEGDCSMEDGPAMFATDEIQDESGVSEKNIACGENPDYLYDIDYYYTTYTGFKTSPNSVIFAAIVGVPEKDACQGTGDTLGDCLDHPDMELNPIIKPSPTGVDTWYYEDACTRGTVTQAKPGRRYVKLANEEFGKMSFVYSICNADWGPAMEEIARLIASNLAGTCYEKPLDWDPSTRQAKCDVVVEFINPKGEDCPDEFDDDEPVIVEEEEDDEVERTFVYCRMPKLTAPKDCGDENFDWDNLGGKFGWYYCENLGVENFKDACEDGEDNDGDGDVDCDDDDCGTCQCCGGSDACTGLCKYMVQLTASAEEAAKQLSISVQCLQQFSFEDENCQEDSVKACEDDLDNDGNGIWDCESVTIDEDPDNPHSADPNCCPMIREGEDTTCKEIKTDFCDGDDPTKIDACVAHASLLGCNLPE